MATVTTQPPRADADVERRVASPLHQLRGIIRFYVTAEGMAAAVLYLTACFWIGLALDYGVFKLTGVDWIVLPRALRGTFLGLAVLGLVALVVYKVFSRLFFDFRSTALALLLERRFPKLLGDRLITAVELADTRKAERYGYSRLMIEQTIREAADRVAQAPVREVFNWRRLVVYGITAVVFSIGVYLLVGAGYCGVQAAFPAEKREGFVQYAQRFNQVAGIWCERNVLLRNVPWPRRALLVIADFPESERRIGRDSPAMTVNVQAYQWVVAASDEPEGWRPMVWSDVGRFVSSMPTLPSAAETSARWQDLDPTTIDEIEAFTKKEEVPLAVKGPFLEVLDELERQAAFIPRQRSLRKLEVPEDVRLSFYGTTRGSTIDNVQTLEPGTDRRFTGTLPELKEAVKLFARGADYRTPTKLITVVPPPELNQLTRDEYQPAYLYYRLPPSVDSTLLKGKRQHVQGPVSLSGDVCRLDVPFGTDIVLTGQVYVFEDKEKREAKQELKPLKAITVKATAGVMTAVRPEIVDPRTFKVRLDNVTSPLDFMLEFTDENNVIGFRHVVVKPVEDMAPDVDVQVEVVRKTNQGYLITPRAMIYFSGKLKDDHGLAHAEYVYSLAHLETQPSTLVQALQAARVVGLEAFGAYPTLCGLARDQAIGRNSDVQESPPTGSAIKSFDVALRDREFAQTLPGALDALLAGTPPDRAAREQKFLKEFTLNADEEFFDVEKLGLKPLDENAPQPRYRLRLWIRATDCNVEAKKPGEGQSKEKFTLLVVSENELLAEIAKEEEGLNGKLDDAVNRLKDARLKLEKVITDLKDTESKPIFPRWTVDAGEVGEAIAKSSDVGREVLSDYRRILKELMANRVQPGMISRVRDKIVEPLDLAVREDFPRAENSGRAFVKRLKDSQRDADSGAKAMNDLQTLIDRLTGIQEAMEGITKINQLIAKLVEIEKDEVAQYEILIKLKKEKEIEILKQLTDPGSK